MGFFAKTPSGSFGEDPIDLAQHLGLLRRRHQRSMHAVADGGESVAARGLGE